LAILLLTAVLLLNCALLCAEYLQLPAYYPNISFCGIELDGSREGDSTASLMAFVSCSFSVPLSAPSQVLGPG
jgi:hypothetical protein